MSLVYTQLGNDRGTGSNQNPINPANWTTIAPYADFKLFNNTIQPSVAFGVNDCLAYFSSVVTPNDQYGEFKLTSINGGEIGIELRTDPITVSLYDFDLFDNGDGTLDVSLLLFINNGVPTNLFENVALPFNQGDMFRATAVGTTLSLYQNGALVFSVQNGALTSGSVGLFASVNATTDVQLNNFSMGSITQSASYTLTPTFTDSFIPNANPINPSVWGPCTVQGWTDLQALNGKAQATTPGGITSGNIFIGSPLPDDQYLSFTLTDWVINNGQEADFFFRSQDLTNDHHCYEFSIADNGGGGTASAFLVVWTNAPSQTVLYENDTVVVNPNDTFTIAALGTSLLIFQNGVLLFPIVTDSTYSGGRFGLDLTVSSALDATLSNLNFGSITSGAPYYSVPDCRIVPNNSRNVQDTLIYDVPPSESLQYWFDTSFNRTEPLPVDSRAAGAPTDSRTADNIPTNSRTPGTYGPGE